MDFFDELQQSDWLGRDLTNFTYKTKKGGVDWGLNKATESAVSINIVPKVSPKTKIEKKLLLAKQACNSLASAMNSGNKRLKIRFSKDFTNYQYKDNICVTLQPLNPKYKFTDFNHALDPILGYCVHEVAHSLFTPEAEDEETIYYGKMTEAEKIIKYRLNNFIEDERIESKVSDYFPGYTPYIGKAKDFAFGVLDEESSNIESNDTTELLSAITSLIRYPKTLDKNLAIKFEKELREVMDILTPYPSTYFDVMDCTDKIYQIILRFFTDTSDTPDSDDSNGQDSLGSSSNGSNSSSSDGSGESKDDQQQPENSEGEAKQGEKGEGNGDQANASEKEGTEQPEEGEQKDKTDNSDKEGDESDSTEEEADKDESSKSKEGEEQPIGEATKEADKEVKSSEDLLDELKDLLAAFEKAEMKKPEDLDELKGVLGQRVKARAIEKIDDLEEEDLKKLVSVKHKYPDTENLGLSEMNITYVDKKKALIDKEYLYDDALGEVSEYASSLRAKIRQLNRNKQIINSGLAEGDFDDTLLVDSIVGSKNVYKEEYTVTNSGACIGLLIDESASMRSGRNWYKAMQIAILFERALLGVNNVDFYCYGHTTGKGILGGGYSENTILNIYFEGRKKSNRKALSNISTDCTNRDGHAIFETVARMRTQVDKKIPIILFMVSDGEPSASVPDGYNGVTYTKKAVDTCEKYDNASIIHIAIEEDIPSEDMFKSYVKFTDPTSLVRDIGQLLKRIMIKQQSTTVL